MLHTASIFNTDFNVFLKRGTLSTETDTFEEALKLEWCQKVNTEKEINKVEDKNKQRVQLRANALHSGYSMFNLFPTIHSDISDTPDIRSFGYLRHPLGLIYV